jgi:hypothetical protein
MAALNVRLKELLGREQKFRPLPASWLNSEPWSDNLTIERYDRRYFLPNSTESVAALPMPKPGSKEYESWKWSRTKDKPYPAHYPEDEP